MLAVQWNFSGMAWIDTTQSVMWHAMVAKNIAAGISSGFRSHIPQKQSRYFNRDLVFLLLL